MFPVSAHKAHIHTAQAHKESGALSDPDLGRRVLVTGAGGKTGRAVVAAAAARGLWVRAAVRTPQAAALLHAAGAAEVVTADLLNSADVERALAGVGAVYHICPNVHPREVEMGALLIAAAARAGVARAVYHSVLHPLTAQMPHHTRKLEVERLLLASGLRWSVLQPTAYMENIAAQLPRAHAAGIFAVPYAPTAAISLVALEDVAAAAAIVLAEPGHDYATYPLAGTPPLTQHDVAAALGAALGRSVRAVQQPLAEWEVQAAGLDAARRATLVQMFRYYDQWGLPGNPNVLRWLLGRAPTPLAAVLSHLAAGYASSSPSSSSS